MNLYEQIAYKGHNINIYYDKDAESPRTAFENLGTLYTAHRRYQPEKDFDEHFDINEVFEKRIGDFRCSFLKKYIVLPVYLYDHSGQTVATTPFSCPWDSGFFGIIAVPLNKVRDEYGWKKITAKRRTLIESYLQNEIVELDKYYRGEIYGYQVVEQQTEKEIDSCWGFWGDSGLNQLQKEAEAIIDHELKN